MSTLNARQQAFVAEYLIDLNATQAAIRAGYSAKTAPQAASRLLTNVEISKLVNRTQSERAEKLEITAASITARLMSIADKAELMDGPGALSVARQSMMDVAKLNGLVVDSHETVTRSPEERRSRLNELRAERERLTRSH
jgi:phage terminase small subunit